MLRLGANLLWFILVGWANLVLWLAVGIILAITIVGLPWARAAFTLAFFAAWPVGRDAVSRYELTGQHDIGTGPLGTLGNVLWFILGGWALVLSGLIGGVYLICTIIGIPFALQQFKIAGLSLAPVGKTIVSKEVYKELQKRKAYRTIDDAQQAAQERANRESGTSTSAISTSEPTLIGSQPTPALAAPDRLAERS